MSSSQPEALFSFPGYQEKLDIPIKAPEVPFMQKGSKVEVEEPQSNRARWAWEVKAQQDRRKDLKCEHQQISPARKSLNRHKDHGFPRSLAP